MNEVFNEEDRESLAHTRRIRMNLVNELTSNESSSLPSDNDDKKLLTSLLNDIDGNVAKSVRAKTYVKEVENGQQQTDLVRGLLEKRAIQKSKSKSSIPDVKLISDDMPILPGENDIGITDLRLEDIVHEK